MAQNCQPGWHITPGGSSKSPVRFRACVDEASFLQTLSGRSGFANVICSLLALAKDREGRPENLQFGKEKRCSEVGHLPACQSPGGSLLRILSSLNRLEPM